MAEEDNKKVTIDDILKERRNIFDNDEFDILRNGKIDMNKVILGKKKYVVFYFILFYFILFYFILFYFILFYFILFYFILFYFILFYSI